MSEALPPRRGPLRDIKVLDLGVVIAGPLVGCYLGDLGADVVKVERPSGDPSRATGRHVNGASLIWKYIGRNKRTLSLDLNTDEGRARALALAAVADIVVENFRPGTLEKWGLGWEALHAANPRLILVRISGFGQHGPYRERPGFGTIAESMAGFTGLNGWPDGPPTLAPVALADTAAAKAATIAALAALHRRHVSGGEGELVDVSLIEPLFSLFSPQFIDYNFFGEEPKRVEIASSLPRRAEPIAARTVSGSPYPALHQRPRARSSRPSGFPTSRMTRVLPRTPRGCRTPTPSMRSSNSGRPG